MSKVQSPSGFDPQAEDPVPAWLEALAGLGGTLELRGNRLAVRPVRVFRQLSLEMLEVWRTHRAEIKAAVRRGWTPTVVAVEAAPPAPAPTSPPSRPDPVVYANGRRITEDDVRECLLDMGDDVLRDYERGVLPKSEAFEMTRCWKKQIKELMR